MTVPQSLSRTVFIPPGGFDFPGSLPPVDRWPDKSSEGVLDYWVDATRWCADGGDTLAAASVAIAPAGEATDLVAESVLVVGTGLVLLWLKSGQPGVVYELRITVYTALGRTETFLVLIFVNEASPPFFPIIILSADDTLAASDETLVASGAGG